DDAGGAGDALEQPEDHEQGDGGRERAGGAGQDVGGHADDEGPASSPAVAHRPDDQLAGGEAQQAGGEGELDGGGGAVQGGADLGEGRQVHVHGQRRQRGEAAQDEGEQQPGALGGAQVWGGG